METPVVKEISPQNAWQWAQKGARIVDIRELARFNECRVPNSFHLTSQSFVQLEREVEFDTPILVICYRGNSSRNTAQFLTEQGYDEVYSIQGGMEGWFSASLPLEYPTAS